MQKTPWEILGLPPDTSLDELRRAFRRLAREQHPDRRPGDAAAEERFKTLVAAFAAACDSRQGRGRPADRRSGAPRERRSEGPDVSASFALSLGEALRGGPHRLRLTASPPCPSCRGRPPRRTTCPSCAGRGVRQVVRSVRLVVPAESRDGDLLRLPGEGASGPNDRRGDLLVRLAVRLPPGARLDRDDLHLDLPLRLDEAWAGTRLDVATPTGPVVVAIPPALDPRTPLRLRAHGLARRGPDAGKRGDLVLHPLVVPPDCRDPAAAAAVRHLAPFYSAPLRSDFDRWLD